MDILEFIVLYSCIQVLKIIPGRKQKSESFVGSDFEARLHPNDVIELKYKLWNLMNTKEDSIFFIASAVRA